LEPRVPSQGEGASTQELLKSHQTLVGALTHELRGLLSALEGGLYLFETGWRKGRPERVEEGVAQARRSLVRLKHAVEHGLYYAKDRELSPGEHDLPEVVKRASEAVSSQAGQAGLKLEAAAEAGVLLADGAAVHALLVLMLEHAMEACRACKAAGPKVIKIEAFEAGWGARFEVGHPGVYPERGRRARALEELYRPDGPDRSGLWVHLASRLARACGGSLEGSDDGLATRWTVKLPAGSKWQED
jgi:signal transduction histidine kinase